MVLEPKTDTEICPKLVPESVLFFVTVGNSFFGSETSLGKLFCSLLGLLGLSWGVSRAKKCRQSHAKSTFSKVFLLVSWSSFVSLGLLLASPGPVLEPRWPPKGAQKGA